MWISIHLTNHLYEADELLGIKLLDHLIIEDESRMLRGSIEK